MSPGGHTTPPREAGGGGTAVRSTVAGSPVFRTSTVTRPLRATTTNPRVVLVTGAGGFLGTHVSRTLSAIGYHVIGVSADYPVHALISAGVRQAVHEIELPDRQFEELLATHRPQSVVHCAGTADVAASFRDPNADFQANVEITEYVLERIRRICPGSQFVLLSSAAVYGDPERLPIREDAPLRPISPYGFHKRICEQLVEEYSALHGVRSVILRIFSAYGEGLSRQVIHDLCRKVAESNGEGVRVIGTGDESRDFVHAEDVARTVAHAIESGLSGTFNLASGHETPIRDLVDQLLSLSGSPNRPTYTGTTRRGDPVRWQADISAITRTGFQPRIDLSMGLHRYWRWFTESTSTS